MANKTTKKYELTPEHGAELKPWAERWIANALRTAPRTPREDEKLRVAMRGLYAAAKLEPPPPHREVLCASPIGAAIAASVAAGAWWVRENPTKHAELFGGPVSEPVLMGAVRDAVAHAVAHGMATVRSAGKRPLPAAKPMVPYAATYAATYDATDAATRAATDAATRAATDAATDAATYAATRAATRAATDAATYAATDAATHAATDAATRAATYAATRAATDAATYAATHAATDAATDAATYAATRAATHDATSSALVRFLVGCCSRWSYMRNGGNQWSGWLAFMSFFRHIAKLDLHEYEKWQHYEEAAVLAGPRLMHAKFWIASDFPTVIGKDERNRPHSATGPSIAWRDGWAVYSWHGTRVDERVIMAPESFTADELRAERNAEISRALAERLGWPKYLDALGTVTVDTWTDPRTGLLYELLSAKERKGDRMPKFLKMLSPALLDGSQPSYIEAVNWELKTARGARRWQVQNPDGSWPEPAWCDQCPGLEYAKEA